MNDIVSEAKSAQTMRSTEGGFNDTNNRANSLRSRLVSYTENETRFAMDSVKLRRKKGGDLSIGHPKFCAGAQNILAAAREGIIFFFSPVQLDAAFAFAKLDAGRGLLGGQKAVFASYVTGDLEDDEWEIGTTFKSWGIACTSIGNVYRGNGFR